MRALVAALTVFGAALTLAGLGWGARRLLAEHRMLVRDLSEVQRINADDGLSLEEQTLRKAAVRPPSSTLADIEYFREWVRRFVLEQAVSGLGWPATLTVGGVLVSTAASVWSLWV